MLSDDLDKFFEGLIKQAKSVIVSKDPDEPFIIVEVEGGLVYVTFDEKESVRALNISIGRMASLEYFLQDRLGRFVGRKAILTVGCIGNSGGPYTHKWDVNRRGRRLMYGYSREHYLMLIAKISWCLDSYGLVSIVLRSFTGRVDPSTNLEIKELRGYVLRLSDGGIDVENVAIDDLIDAETTDPQTGRKLPHEPAVEYCSEDQCIPSSHLMSSD